MNEVVKHRILGMLMLVIAMLLVWQHEYGGAFAVGIFAAAGLTVRKEQFDE